MNWNLEGMRVSGRYMGEFPVTGKVELSRVKYGGEISHHVVLDEPISLRWRTEPVSRVILEHKVIEQVWSN